MKVFVRFINACDDAKTVQEYTQEFIDIKLKEYDNERITVDVQSHVVVEQETGYSNAIRSKTKYSAFIKITVS